MVVDETTEAKTLIIMTIGGESITYHIAGYDIDKKEAKGCR